jgi:hypothetical protein
MSLVALLMIVIFLYVYITGHCSLPLSLLGTNTPAYVASLSVTMIKSFYNHCLQGCQTSSCYHLVQWIQAFRRAACRPGRPPGKSKI